MQTYEGNREVKNHKAIFTFGANSKLLYVEAQETLSTPSTIIDIDK